MRTSNIAGRHIMGRMAAACAMGMAALALTACGGGGTSGGAATAVLGKVSQATDGAGRAGVRVTDEATGARAVTDARGDFRLDVAPGTRVRLRCEDPDAARERPEESLDFLDELPADVLGYDDDAVVDGDAVDLAPLDEGEARRCDIEMLDGRILSCEGERPDVDRERVLFGTSRLYPPEEPESDREGESDRDSEEEASEPARGLACLACTPSCCRLAILAGRLAAEARFEVVLLDGDVVAGLLGVIETNGRGFGALFLRRCTEESAEEGTEVREADGEEALDPRWLMGRRIAIRDADEVFVLVGRIPRLEERKDEPARDVR